MRGRTRSARSASSSVGTSLSRPASATWTGGSVFTRRPLPSLVTMARHPVSAMQKLAPEMPMSASKNFGRSSRRATFTRRCTSSWSCFSPVAFSNSSATCPRERCMAGITMCDGPSWRSCMIHSPRSVSQTCRPCFSRWALRPISSAVIDLDFTMRFTPFSAAIRAMMAQASAASAARWTITPRDSASRLKRS